MPTPSLRRLLLALVPGLNMEGTLAVNRVCFYANAGVSIRSLGRFLVSPTLSFLPFSLSLIVSLLVPPRHNPGSGRLTCEGRPPFLLLEGSRSVSP